MSPYSYCRDNPIALFDPEGSTDYYISDEERTEHIDDDQDKAYLVPNGTSLYDKDKNIVTKGLIDLGPLNQREQFGTIVKGMKSFNYESGYIINNKQDGLIEDSKGAYRRGKDQYGMIDFISEKCPGGYSIIDIHLHPEGGTTYPSKDDYNIAGLLQYTGSGATKSSAVLKPSDLKDNDTPLFFYDKKGIIGSIPFSVFITIGGKKKDE